ncbi:LysR family transcriptional regulator [Glutamicibacter sp. PS]|uniref:LysR family transcriptional regulator n=1 Tax=Glutamicibacter sp. PS TaxID=3075634 RepID=UPI002844210E|nr:LysR family transcriptional regulator [Glutamicibacter sp. PS]MDR4534776.1 LysR family transcriptional regulator [Glutamicibacter sp. PS]
MLDLRQLQALLAVAETGSITGAARRLGWSQPAVNHHLQNLDRLMGAPLTGRTSQGTTLTDTGRLVARQGAEILNLSEQLVEEVRAQVRGQRPRVRLGIVASVVSAFLPAISARLAERGLGLDTRLGENPDLIEAVQQRSLDAAVIYTLQDYPPVLGESVRSRTLLRDPLLLALPEDHPAAHEAQIQTHTLRQLHRERWVFGVTDNDPIDRLIREHLADTDAIESVIHTDDFSVLLNVVAAGLSIGVVSRLGAAHPPQGVVLRPFADPRFHRMITLISHERSAASAAEVRHAIVGAAAHLEP